MRSEFTYRIANSGARLRNEMFLLINNLININLVCVCVLGAAVLLRGWAEDGP